MRFKIDWASLIAGRTFTFLALLYFVFEGNFQVHAPRGAYIWRGELAEDFLRYKFGELVFVGAYTWTGLFSEFYICYSSGYSKYSKICECSDSSFSWMKGMYLMVWGVKWG